MIDAVMLEVVVGLALTVVCVLIHVAGSGLLLWQIRGQMHWLHHESIGLRQAGLLVGLTLGLMLLHALEIWVFALAYLGLGGFPDLETALYVSTGNYATVGRDELAPDVWRLLGAWEGLVGFVLIGWSTALFISTVLRVWSEDHKWFDLDR